MKLASNILTFILFSFIVVLVCFGFYYKDDLYSLYKQINNYKITEVNPPENNYYYKEKSYNYVSLTNDFMAKDKIHLKNILYTIVNSGISSFTFYCDENYETCISDFNKMVADSNFLSSINNFVHPFNSFTKITTTTTDNGKIIISPTKKYSEEDIDRVNIKVDEIINNNINNKMSDMKKIEIIHNYIINHSKYQKSSNNDYGKATDILLDGEGVCSAYTDTMAIFLFKFNIDNYKIASATHIWNLVFVNNSWLHLDLTFDDPLTNNGSNILLNDMLLITTSKLKMLDEKSHNFDSNIYIEAQK